MENKSEPVTIDLTPTWTGVLPILLAAIESGTEEGRKIATDELRRAIKMADKWNDEVRARKAYFDALPNHAQPWQISIESTCSAAWAEIKNPNAAPEEDGDICTLGTTHVFDSANHDPAKEAGGYDERPELFVRHENHDAVMQRAREIAALPLLLTFLKKANSALNLPRDESAPSQITDLHDDSEIILNFLSSGIDSAM